VIVTVDIHVLSVGSDLHNIVAVVVNRPKYTASIQPRYIAYDWLTPVMSGVRNLQQIFHQTLMRRPIICSTLS